jgi:hypothetical protein
MMQKDFEQYRPETVSWAAANTNLFNHLVGGHKERLRHCDIKRLGGL